MPHKDPQLDALLHRTGLTQREIARRMGYHPNTVCRWEAAPRPVLAYLELYAEATEALGGALERIKSDT